MNEGKKNGKCQKCPSSNRISILLFSLRDVNSDRNLIRAPYFLILIAWAFEAYLLLISED